MTNAEEVRELRNWLREEAKTNRDEYRDLHKKIDDGNLHLHAKIDACNNANQEEHKDLGRRIGELNTENKVTGSKILGLSGLVSLLVSGVVIVAFQALAGG
jgi:hypothetical protein